MALDLVRKEAKESSKNKFQNIVLAQNVTATSTDLSGTTGNSAFIFNNLVIGKVYKVTYSPSISLTGTTATESMVSRIFHDGNTIAAHRHRNDGQSDESANLASITAIFVATATTVLFGFGEAGTGVIVGDGTLENTKASLEELNNYIITTDFT